MTTILKEMQWQDVNWIQLALDRDKWRNYTSNETDLLIPKMWGIL
jgi:hypothetical protein